LSDVIFQRHRAYCQGSRNVAVQLCIDGNYNARRKNLTKFDFNNKL